jgi:hypothetical protein
VELRRVSDGLLNYSAAPGIYTDTAEYSDIIPECSNLSVGYAQEHSPRESLDTEHVFDLVRAMSAFDAERIVIARDPNQWEVDLDDWPDSPLLSRGSYSGYSGTYMHDPAIVLRWPDDDDGPTSDTSIYDEYDELNYLDPDTARVQRWLRADLTARYGKGRAS